MCEVRTHNYDPEIHEEYLIHDTLFTMLHHLCVDCTTAINTIN